ncbi:hypothetical protein [Phaffia rhodozyma]|uniref:Uncharacterized protein n=1 Tax=Phaffia rhodozyma TaxID=264483 RepID=A0A0F7SNP1_PHARH|nr:hypothetical protein [Phaffia rhodozyma]
MFQRSQRGLSTSRSRSSSPSTTSNATPSSLPEYSPSTLNPTDYFPPGVITDDGVQTTKTFPEDSIARISLDESLLAAPPGINHLITSALSLNPTKSKATLELSEILTFVRPPGLSSQEGTPLLMEADRDGADGKINGFFNVVSDKRKLAKGIKVEFIGQQRILFPGETSWEDDEIARREVILGGHGSSGVWLEKGVNSFEFSFCIPSDSSVWDRCAFGKVLHLIRGSVQGSGNLFKSKLTDQKTVFVIANPHVSGHVPAFEFRQEAYSSSCGPFKLSMTSSEFIISAPLLLSLTFSHVQPVTVYAINCYMVQTTSITSTRPGRRHEIIRGPRRFVYQEGAKSGYELDGFAEKAREAGDVVLDGDKHAGKVWTWGRVGRIPHDDIIRSTTLPGTKTSLRFTCELVFEIVFTEKTDPSTVKIATLYKEQVMLASCSCMRAYVSLPDYAEEGEINHPGDMSDVCMCRENWDALRRQELARPGGGQFFKEGIRIRELMIEDELSLALAAFREPSPARPRKLGETFGFGSSSTSGSSSPSLLPTTPSGLGSKSTTSSAVPSANTSAASSPLMISMGLMDIRPTQRSGEAGRRSESVESKVGRSAQKREVGGSNDRSNR